MNSPRVDLKTCQVCVWRLFKIEFLFDLFERQPWLAGVFCAPVGHHAGEFLILSGALDFRGEISAVANVKTLPA